MPRSLSAYVPCAPPRAAPCRSAETVGAPIATAQPGPTRIQLSPARPRPDPVYLSSRHGEAASASWGEAQGQRRRCPPAALKKGLWLSRNFPTSCVALNNRDVTEPP